MRVELVWQTETTLCWQFHGWIGVMDYIIPMNDTATQCVLSDQEKIDVILEMSWSMPLPNRHFKYLRQAILSAPPQMHSVTINTRNPLTAWVIEWGLLRPYPELQERRVRRTKQHEEV